MIIAEILKFLGVILSAALAVYATTTDHLKTSNVSGSLTRKGWTIIVLAVIGVLISGGAQLFQILDVIDNGRKNLERQVALTNRLENITYQAVRQYYPLEPITLAYVLEYPMDQPYLSQYAEEVRERIYNYLVEQRQGRRETDPSLKNENVTFRLSSRDDWLPTEREAHFNLISDSAVFSFKANADLHELKFLSVPSGYEDVLVSRPIKGRPDQKITLFADFSSRVFRKEVVSENPLRAGSDLSSVSAIDLVSKRMTWSSGSSILPENANAKWHLIKVSFIFPFDFDEGSTSSLINSIRAFEIPEGDTSITIIPEHVGLKDVFAGLGLEPNVALPEEDE